MAKYLVRRFFGLTVLYIIIIFGIFAIQFRKEMSIFQNFQSLNLRLSTDTSNTDETQTILSNNFRVSGNGIVLFATESNPVILQKESGQEIPLTLQTWEEQDENSFSLHFSNDIALNFHADEVGFDLQSIIPNSRDTVIIPYETASSYNITDVLKNKVIVKSREKSFSLLAGNITTSTLLLSSLTSTFAQVAAHEERQAFSYTSIVGMENATQEALDTLVTTAKNHIVRAFGTSQSDASSEKYIAAYVAEMATQGRYAEAIANVPASFINGNNRTYFTSPYFNTLVSMNQTLMQENENISFSMQYSLERNLLDVYKLDNFPTFLLQQNTSNIEAILQLPATMETFAPTVQQATGILDTYVTLAKYLPSSAALLEPVLEQCVIILENASSLNNELLSIISDDGAIDNAFAAKAGSVLKAYGELKARTDLIAGGTMLLSSALQNATLLPSSMIAYMYPYFTPDNPYYPHADVLGYNEGTPIWMWNIIPEKDYTVDTFGTITMQFDFPVTEIYHSIITGIKPFESIEIYGLDYATDSRFETYNAPGYVYIDDTGTLLLRYRQRNEIEEMRLIYEPLPPEPTEPSAEGQATTNTQIEVPSESL